MSSHAPSEARTINSFIYVPTVDPPSPQLSSSAIVRGFLLGVVATVFEVDATLLVLNKRGIAPVARARQVAMYLAHVGCGLSLTEVGRLFERDRTTVAHACHVIEEHREDNAFDQVIETLEHAVRTVNRLGGCKWVV
ncbi:MAG: helix-turn-helix domain-containing protein [Hyphomicrobiaceae bacterium]